MWKTSSSKIYDFGNNFSEIQDFFQVFKIEGYSGLESKGVIRHIQTFEVIRRTVI